MEQPSSTDAWARAFADQAFVTRDVIARMQAHWRLVMQWNRRSNLTAIVGEEDAIWLHYRDSLAAWPWLTGGSVVDFGSGAGFPGLVLAMAGPQREVTLVEPRRRRFSFLCHAVAHLGLHRVTVRQAKVEDPPAGSFAHAVTRATFSSGTFVADARAWLKADGTLLCFRGPGAPQWGTRHTYTLDGPRSASHQRCIDVLPAAQALQER